MNRIFAYKNNRDLGNAVKISRRKKSGFSEGGLQLLHKKTCMVNLDKKFLLYHRHMSKGFTVVQKKKGRCKKKRSSVDDDDDASIIISTVSK